MNFNRGRKLPDLPKSRELTAGPVRRIDPREPWPADDLAQVARRNGMTGKDLLSMLERQGHGCALCGGAFHPWRKTPRVAAESPGELVCVGCLTRLQLAGGAYWERKRYVG